MEPWKPHPNLSKDINDNIAESELLGGCRLDEFPDGRILHIITQDTHYEFTKAGLKEFIRGHAKTCPDWTECSVTGSTWGGSMLKMRYAGIGMHLEFHLAAHGTLTTSKVVSVYENDN